VIEIWNAIKDFLASGIELLHGVFEPVFGDAAWGWAIIGLTIVVRILLIPLAVKQFHSMRAMQELSPQVKAIQKKYKVDRSMMRSDPERYRKLQTKKNEELQALYKEHDVSPAAGCLPLLAQGPIFLALFQVLRDPTTLDSHLITAPFYFFTPDPGVPLAVPGNGEVMAKLGANASQAGWAGILLILMVAASMFVSQKQMMARNAASQGDMQATQQKVMLYAMPLMMGVFSWNLPLGVLLYWVTTNLWTMVQQAIIMREVEHEAADASAKTPVRPRQVDASGAAAGSAGNVRRAAGDRDADVDDDGGKRGRKKRSKPGSATDTPSAKERSGKESPAEKAPGKKPSGKSSRSSSNGSGASEKRSSHLPSRSPRRRR
jgi:YidC/Oxa1 family membrane protein insertase